MKKLILASTLILFALSTFAQEEKAAPADQGEGMNKNLKYEIPLAPEAYRRPADYELKLFDKNLRTLSEEYSAEFMERSHKEMERINKVNSKGRYQATGKSIDGHKCPEWFMDAKFGIFIDWGLWSIASWCPDRGASRLYPDWYEQRLEFNYTQDSPNYGYHDYHIKNWGEDFKRDHFIDLFKASRFDADALCSLFKKCGAGYVVPFSKHHSGFCLWDSSWTFRDVIDQGPHRDIDGELVESCKKNGLKFGFYFSAGEWEYPVLRNGEIQKFMEWERIEPYTDDMEYKASGKVAVNDFVYEYLVPQAVEFIDKYNPDILWYDYDWIMPATKMGTYDISAYFYNKNDGVKEVCVNDRYGLAEKEEIEGRFTKSTRYWLRTVRGDFYTDELGDTSEYIDPADYHPWECCRGLSRSFGNHWGDTAENVMSKNEFICEFADIVARGGNLLFLINLDGQGAIPEVQQTRLLEIGQWLKRFGNAIYGTRVLAPYNTEDVDYVKSKDDRYAYAIIKKPVEKIEIECKVPARGRAKLVGSLRWLKTIRKDGKTYVCLPEKYIADGSPIAIRFKMAKNS